MIQFFWEDTENQLIKEEVVSRWLINAIEEERAKARNINIVFCSDSYLHELNKKYLDHDTYTDIITFDYSDPSGIEGELFISVDRVKENAKKNEVTYSKELDRVMIHGVLHLLGYQDKSPEQAHEIRAKEDFYLALRSN